jgi:putative transposase
MPWKETCLMDEKVSFIAACREEGNFAEVCRRFGISRKTGYKWLGRYDGEGIEGLKERPPIVVEPPNATPVAVVSAIVTARKEHPLWGPKKLRAVLLQAMPDKHWPAPSTIGEVLKRHGMIRPRRRRVRGAAGRSPLGECELPNDVWCVDFKGHFALGDKSRCHPLTITDAASRYLFRCEGLVAPKGEPVKEHFTRLFREFGLPSRIRSDNGAPFASTAPGGLSALSIWWIKQGITPERIEPGHPEQNGRHERMHRTLKDATASPPRATMAEQQLCFDAFRYEYNEVRPHEALGQRPPASVYEVSKRPFLDVPPPLEYEDCKVRWAHGGVISWRHQSVKVGPSSLHDEPVGLRQISESEWMVSFGPVLLGVLDTRDTEMQLRAPSPPGPVDDTPGLGSVTPTPVTVSSCPVCVTSSPVPATHGPVHP